MEKHNHLNYNQNLSYQKFVKAKLISVNKKFANHMANVFFKIIKVLIHFVLSSSWVCVCKAQLRGQHLIMKNVIDKPNLHKILNSKLGCREIKSICTFLDYLHHLRKNVFVMICQLGPLTFVVTFTNAESKWVNLIEIFHELKDSHNISSTHIQHEDKHIYELVKGNLITGA